MAYYSSFLHKVERVVSPDNGAAGLWARHAHHSFQGNLSPIARIEPTTSLRSNNSEFVCSICEGFVVKGQGVVLKSCSHHFCRKCLTDAVLNNKNPEHVLCPITVIKCSKVFTDAEIQVLLTPREYAVHLQNSCNLLEKVSSTNSRKTDTVPDLLNLETFDFVANHAKFECAICLTVITPGHGVILKNCLHEYCKPCLGRAVEMSEDPVVKCPFIAEDGSHCEGFMQDSELRSVITQQIYDAHLKKSLAKAEAMIPNSFHCKTPDCPGWAEVLPGATVFSCPICSKLNCITCKEIHEGLTCQQHFMNTNEGARENKRKAQENKRTEAQVQKLIKNKTAMACPRCGVIIEKNQGCNHMTCSRCKTEFQWLGLQ